jgi:hypothetical protein
MMFRDFGAAMSGRGGVLLPAPATAPPQTQFWSMRETYSGSVTLSSIKILGFHLSKKCLEQRGLAGEFDRLSASLSCPVAARFFS